MENLNEQLNRIKSMMGLINEKTPNVGVITDYIENFKNITNEKDLISILTSRGFEKIEDLEIAKTYKLDLNKYKWVYYNPKRKSYLAKFKDDDTMFGLQSKFDPKTQTKTSAAFKNVKGYPLDLTQYDEFLSAPEIDESYDLPSIVRDLDSIRNMYHGFIEKDKVTGKIVYVESKKELSDGAIKVYKDSMIERMKPNMSYIEKLTSPEDKTKQVKSEKFGNTFNNIYEYYKFVEKETKDLGIY
jgi:hypothetical protein